MFDVALDIDGDLPHVTTTIRDGALVAQRVAIRLRTFRGEVLSDASEGMPYKQPGVKLQPASVAALATREALRVPGVKRADLRAVPDADPERAVVVGTLTLDDGDTAGIRVPVGAPWRG